MGRYSDRHYPIRSFPDTHPAIIDRALFEDVQKRLSKRKRMERIEDTPLFASMIFCTDCHSRMHLMRTRGSTPDSYICSSYRNLNVSNWIIKVKILTGNSLLDRGFFTFLRYISYPVNCTTISFLAVANTIYGNKTVS